MNYLAHLFLSGDNDKVKVGNFIADWVKGNSYKQYPLAIQEGILIHRAIDFFTDQHPLHRHSRMIFAPNYGRFSGIVVDVVYDHFLSRHWDEYSKIDRLSFIAQSYEIIETYRRFLPRRPRQLLPSMIYHDWMGAYVSMTGLERVLHRMSRRTSLPPMTVDAIEILRNNYQSLDDDFMAFFPLLINHVATNSDLLSAITRLREHHLA